MLLATVLTLGTSYCDIKVNLQVQKRGTKRQPVESVDTCQYVPLLENLEWLLQNKDFYNEVMLIIYFFASNIFRYIKVVRAVTT